MRYSPWKRRLQALDGTGLTRRLRPLTPTGPVTAIINGRQYIVASSNDYLGLAYEVGQAATGTGCGASRLLTGDRPIHHQLEEALEALFGRPALVFPSGYHANLAVFSTVGEASDLLCSDAQNHASIIDGLRLSPAQKQVVPHAQPQAIPDHARLIVIEGLFSMDGDTPPIASYPGEPWLAVDEAHAVGCLGPQGRGAAAKAGVTPDIIIGTLGKAYGAAGAFVIGPPELKHLLLNLGRSFIFTTGIAEPVAAMALEGVRRATEELREQLAARVRRFRSGLDQLGWKPLGSAHIVPLVVGPKAMEMSQMLFEKGILAPGIRSPTVSVGHERIRFSVSAAHTNQQIDTILEALGQAE